MDKSKEKEFEKKNLDTKVAIHVVLMFFEKQNIMRGDSMYKAFLKRKKSNVLKRRDKMVLTTCLVTLVTIRSLF